MSWVIVVRELRMRVRKAVVRGVSSYSGLGLLEGEGGTHHISMQRDFMRSETELESVVKALKLWESRYHFSAV